MSLTPMMRQYQELKQQHPDALLMFRLGDFYELFFEDAETASRILDITLTGRDAGSAGRVPMCGVPFHSADQYITRLVDHGYAVAICEQTEDPKQAKGLVRREVVRVITPGTSVREDEVGHRYLMAIISLSDRLGIALVDVGTGDVWVDETDTDDLQQILLQWSPAEVLMTEPPQWPWFASWRDRTSARMTLRPFDPARDDVERRVLHQFHASSRTSLGFGETSASLAALGLLLAYLEETQKQFLPHLRPPRQLQSETVLVLDATAQYHLELLATARTRKRQGSLFGLLAKTQTAMGTRLLGHWIERPLAEVAPIEERLDAVQALVEDVFLRSELQSLLKRVYDLERLAAKVSFQTAHARDLLALGHSLQVIPDIQERLATQTSNLLRRLGAQLPNLAPLAQRILNTIVDDPPVHLRDGGIIREGVDDELDELRRLAKGGKTWLAAFEQQERERTGIKSLKVGYNRVFGYYIEVSKANAHLIPEDYERRQTLASAERYVVPALKEQEARILGAEERAIEREYELFVQLREAVLAQIEAIQATASIVAQLDVLCAFAIVSSENRYVRPRIRQRRGIHIRQGRHATVEAMLGGKFVPNDVHLDDERQLMLITGPNMAGKSTYMRQVALIVVMAQMGCFVPAEEAEIGLVDRIFTRIGASDDLSQGQSTFMVEMVELAQILRQATHRSLVLLDEIGRGTSTYDGLCIAEAVVEHLLQPQLEPFVLFATHYHELTETAGRLPKVVNASVTVHEREDTIEFLHTVVNRPADKSYGIQVAKLAGIPDSVIARASELLQVRERQFPEKTAEVAEAAKVAEAEAAKMAAGSAEAAAAGPPASPTNSEAPRGYPLPLFAAASIPVVERLCALNPLEMTPLEALNQLYALWKEAREVMTWDASK
ncbi:DNA mismatch repair protein MutS [Alicyclobacillus herbarius]|uniref:DNA mismatch repair protein MutS n=1 Tax=Alicyclobacillus herbarius TaxID=122960 RepID=UPI00040EF0A5|nr:DNA mismatch repair protein MutS [Alicyclobacillus herbarius]